MEKYFFVYKEPAISAYTYVRNPLLMGYPLEAALKALVGVVDEIVVLDVSTEEDGTSKLISAITPKAEQTTDIKTAIRHYKVPCSVLPHGGYVPFNGNSVDYSVKNSGVLDGVNKAEARKLCHGKYLFQFDVDEVFNGTRQQLDKLCGLLTEEMPIISLGVVEPWGNDKNIRIDVSPEKPRLSLNFPNITHGIPLQYRVYHDGLLYARPYFTDGCDYIDDTTGAAISWKTFISSKVTDVRQRAVFDNSCVEQYKSWFQKMFLVDEPLMPFMYHHSWIDIPTKIRKYKHFWHSSWDKLFNQQNSPGYPFFNKPWEEVTEEDMDKLGNSLIACGGHIAHVPYDGKTIKNTIKL